MNTNNKVRKENFDGHQVLITYKYAKYEIFLINSLNL